MRHEILREFLDKVVDLSPPDLAAHFITWLTPAEIQKYLKNIRVSWYGPLSDIIFKVLVAFSKLDSLGIVIPKDTNTYNESNYQRNILQCQGLDTILNIRECRKVYFVVGKSKRFSGNHLTDGSNSDHIKTMERLLTELCSKPRRPTIRRRITISAQGEERLAEDLGRGLRRKSFAY
jgi:hypothetical protein